MLYGTIVTCNVLIKRYICAEWKACHSTADGKVLHNVNPNEIGMQIEQKDLQE